MKGNSLKRTARVAGLLYIIANLPAPFALLYLPSRLIVRGDAAATANNIKASEASFRLSTVIDLVGAIVNVFVVLALYKLLKPVNKDMASLMVIFLLLSVTIGMLNELNHLAALLLLSGATWLSSLGQRTAWAHSNPRVLESRAIRTLSAPEYVEYATTPSLGRFANSGDVTCGSTVQP